MARLKVIPPPLYFVACLAVASLAHGVHPLDVSALPFRILMTIGSIVMAIGAAIGFWAVRTMGNAQTPPEPWKQPVQLVTSGPFAHSRNPIYVAFLFIMIAIGIMMNSVWIVAAVVPLVILLDRLVIRREEVFLSELFGDDYRAYRSRVRRWL